MAQEKQTQTQPAENSTATEPTQQPVQPQKKSNAAVWVLVSCLGVFLIMGLIVLALVIWGGWFLKKKIDQAQPEIQKWQQTSESLRNQANQISGQLGSVSDQMQGAQGNIPQTFEEPPQGDQNAIGYIKKVYLKSGKNFLDIDYIQWLNEDAAIKAMREDGLCPKTGECIVPNDYYIRNQNPKIRSLEIAPDVRIKMDSYDMETTGQLQAEQITMNQFNQIWSTSTRARLQNAPYYITLANNTIVNIEEMYVP